MVWTASLFCVRVLGGDPFFLSRSVGCCIQRFRKGCPYFVGAVKIINSHATALEQSMSYSRSLVKGGKTTVTIMCFKYVLYGLGEGYRLNFSRLLFFFIELSPFKSALPFSEQTTWN